MEETSDINSTKQQESPFKIQLKEQKPDDPESNSSSKKHILKNSNTLTAPSTFIKDLGKHIKKYEKAVQISKCQQESEDVISAKLSNHLERQPSSDQQDIKNLNSEHSSCVENLND